MTSVLLDTHAWAWSLTDDPCLVTRARAAIARADIVYVSAISFFEIAQKARLGKWPDMVRHVSALPSLLVAQGARDVPVSPAIATLAASFDWPHRDPFDRVILATALELRVPVISADRAFDGLPEIYGSISRIW